MAAEVTKVPARGESFRLFALERHMRSYLADRLQVSTRFAPLGSTRALLVSPADRERPKGLVIDDGASPAERVYLYVHVAAHIALGHNTPLITIVEGEPEGEMAHEQAERLARAMWWRGARISEDAAPLPNMRGSRLLRAALAIPASRAAVRWLLIALRAAYYGSPLGRIAGARAAGWLREALCVTAVVSAAPQLADGR